MSNCVHYKDIPPNNELFVVDLCPNCRCIVPMVVLTGIGEDFNYAAVMLFRVNNSDAKL